MNSEKVWLICFANLLFNKLQFYSTSTNRTVHSAEYLAEYNVIVAMTRNKYCDVKLSVYIKYFFEFFNDGIGVYGLECKL